jgi:hypothetical protein
MTVRTIATLAIPFAGAMLTACGAQTSSDANDASFVMAAEQSSAESLTGTDKKVACDPNLDQSCAGLDEHHGNAKGKVRHKKVCSTKRGGDEFTCRNPGRGHTVGLGYECGGPRAWLCAEGLSCATDGRSQPHASGTCVTAP